MMRLADLLLDERENGLNAEPAQAALVGAFARVAGAAFDVEADDGVGAGVGACADGIRRTEERDNRPVEGGGEVARAAVGGDQEVGPADARLGQPDRRREVGQGVDVRVVVGIRCRVRTRSMSSG